MGPKSKDSYQHPQEKYEKELKDRVEREAAQYGTIPFLFHPPNRYRGRGNIDITKYYLHDVLVVAPHLQFSDIPIPCSCGGRFQPFQWGESRVIHGIDQPVSLLQYRYKCNDCHITMVASELLKTEGCPDIIRLTSTKFYLTNNSGVTCYGTTPV